MMNPYVFCFRSYGAVVRFEAGSADLFDFGKVTATRALVGNIEFIDNGEREDADVVFEVFRDNTGKYRFRYNADIVEHEWTLEGLSEILITFIRHEVAGNANPWVFLHAGAVSWRGWAILLPAESYRGKTSLVKELIAAGAEYYSDDFAVLDENGSVHPFPRDLTIRVPEQKTSRETPAEELGAKTGIMPVPVGMVIFTEYKEMSDWLPEEISKGGGVLAAIPFVILITNKAESALKVLNTAFSRAIILSGSRSEAKIAASQILSFFDNNLELGKIA